MSAGAGWSRRRFLQGAGTAVTAAAGASAGVAATRYEGTAAGRSRADSATSATSTRATSLRVLWRADTTEKVVALTFDDGPGDELTPGLLDALAEARVRATFCVVGRQVRRRPDLLRAQVRAGHEIANHTWSHADLGLLQPDGVTRELDRTNDLLHRLTGRAPAMIRPPYGRTNGAVLQYAARSGQPLLLWDVRFRDDELDTAGNARHVLGALRPGSVVLAHDAGRAHRHVGIGAVPAVVRGALARGFSFVTASEMLDLDREGLPRSG